MSYSDDIAIKVSHVSKNFKLPHESQNSLKGKLINFKKRGYETQHALKDVSFEVKKGEFFGIVGRNGSGKSTLLKIISGIYAPSEGSVTINGKLTPFIELGVGFNPELSGRDNVFLNGALLGFDRKDMVEMYDDIVAFAELERFMDQKLKNYSSGMQVRLAFSIAIRAQSDILVLDEVLAVGDAAFQQKCFDYFKKLKQENKTIILVTHDMNSVKRFCNRALLIKDSVVERIGSPDDIANQYLFENFNDDSEEEFNDDVNGQLTENVKKLDLEFVSPTKLKSDEKLKFNLTYQLATPGDVYLGISIIYQDVSIFEHNSKEIKLSGKAGVEHTVSYELPLDKFYTAPLSINASLFNGEGDPIAHIKQSKKIFVDNGTSKITGGVIQLKGQWTAHDKN